MINFPVLIFAQAITSIGSGNAFGSRLAPPSWSSHSPDVNQDPYATPVESPAAPALPRGGIGDDAGMRLLMPVGRSGWAIAAGYLGLFSLVLVPAPFAILVSILAIRDIRRSAGSAKVKHGMGRAIFGLVMGILGTVFLGIVGVSILTEK